MNTLLRHTIYRNLLLCIVLISTFYTAATLSWSGVIVTTVGLMCWGVLDRSVARMREFSAWIEKGGER